MRRPTSLELIGNSVLAVYDGGQRRLAFFDRASMEARGSFAIGGFNTSMRG